MAPNAPATAHDGYFQKSEIRLPQGACDSHVHLYGPTSKFPFAPERTFTPAESPVETLRQLHSALGFDRSVLVQSAAHGHDHSVLIDAMERFPGDYRAVALLSASATPSEVARLDDAGFCGARVHFAPHLGPPPSQDSLLRLTDMIGPLGWHLEVHTMHQGIQDFAEMYPKLDLQIILDHMGRFDMPSLDELEANSDFKLITSLLQEDDVWVKLSGADRVSREIPSMSDGFELARRLFAARRDRCVWGSDFPHPNTHGFTPEDHRLVNGLSRIAPTDEDLEQLLVLNPSTCFEFPAAAEPNKK